MTIIYNLMNSVTLTLPEIQQGPAFNYSYTLVIHLNNVTGDCTSPMNLCMRALLLLTSWPGVPGRPGSPFLPGSPGSPSVPFSPGGPWMLSPGEPFLPGGPIGPGGPLREGGRETSPSFLGRKSMHLSADLLAGNSFHSVSSVCSIISWYSLHSRLARSSLLSV